MSNTDKNIESYSGDADNEIDLIDVVKKLFEKKRCRFVIRWGIIGMVVGLVIAFSIPKEYISETKITPELTSSSQRKMSGLGTIAAIAGISTGSLASDGDAISANLYPEVIKSVPFIVELFSIEVTSRDGEINTTLYDYMLNEQKSPWWSHVMALPFRALGAVVGLVLPNEEKSGDSSINPNALNKEQTAIFNAIQERLSISLDQDNFMINVAVTMQDPKIAFDIVNVVTTNLQAHVFEYRTKKAQHTLDYTQTIYNEAKLRYYQAQEQHADFSDKNKNVTSSRYLSEFKRLENEMNLAYSIYAELASSLESAKLKVQEETPIYAVVSPATIPYKAAKPSKLMVLITFIFLAVVGSVVYRIFKDKLIEL